MHILSEAKHGFQEHHSCGTQLLMTTHDITTSLDNGKQVNPIVLDFSKAI